MKEEFIWQYDYMWEVFKAIVDRFDDASWLNAGIGYMTPARLSFHLIESTRAYLRDTSDIRYPSGKAFSGDRVTLAEELLPDRKDILFGIGEIRKGTKKWLSELDFNAENSAFPWAGKTEGGVVIFLLRHIVYHIGELNALYYASRGGKAEDLYVDVFVKALQNGQDQ